MEWAPEKSQYNCKQGKEIFFSQGIQTHSVSHSIYIRGSSPVDQSLPSHANNKKALNYTATLSCHHSIVLKLINATSPFVVTGLKIMFLQVTLKKNSLTCLHSINGTKSTHKNETVMANLHFVSQITKWITVKLGGDYNECIQMK